MNKQNQIIFNIETKEKYLKEYNISKNDFVFVNVGNYRSEKNQKFLIEKNKKPFLILGIIILKFS